MIYLKINNFNVQVRFDLSILDVCACIGFKISRFCYHENLAIAGNCRMCLVELNDQSKPIASCFQPIVEYSSINTDTPLLKKAKENILELLLLNHPLDCPVCEQGGSCDLQDHSLSYGSFISKSFFEKRAVDNKNFGFFIETVMNRCIHCTRCLRYFSEITDRNIFGMLFRGSSSEISSYVESNIYQHEFGLYGNVIDLCPVGALNSKYYPVITHRSGEILIIPSIDISDSFGIGISTIVKNNVVKKVIPRATSFFTEGYISDITRFFSFDGNDLNRMLTISHTTVQLKFDSLDRLVEVTPYRFDNIDRLELMPHIHEPFNEEDSLNTIFIDECTDLATINILKKFSYRFGENVLIKSISNTYSKYSNFHISFLSNKLIEMNNYYHSKICFLFGVNTKMEGILLNFKIRKKSIYNDLKVFSLGLYFKSTFTFTLVNLNKKVFIQFLQSKSGILCRLIAQFKTPIFIFSTNLLNRNWSSNTILLTIKKINPSSVLIFLREGANSLGLSFLNIGNLTRFSLTETESFTGINLKENLKVSRYFFYDFDSEFISRFFFHTHRTNFESIEFNFNSFFIPTTSEFESEQIFLNLEERPQKTSVSVKLKFGSFMIEEDQLQNPVFAWFQQLLHHDIGLRSFTNKEYNPYADDKGETKFLKNILTQPKYQNFILEFIKNSTLFSKKINIFNFFALNLFSLNNKITLISNSSIKTLHEKSICSTNSIKQSLLRFAYASKIKHFKKNNFYIKY